MNNIESTLRFIDYYVNKIEFYNNEKFEQKPVELDFQISRKIEFLEDDNTTFLTTLDTKVFENAAENNYPFSINVNITGVFKIDGIDLDKIKDFAEINSISILFPYLRAIISTYTSNANIKPLILPAINVVKLVNSNKND